MGFFSSKKTDEIDFWPGGRLANIKMTYSPSSRIITYRGAYGGALTVNANDVSTVTLSPGGFGKSHVIITGNGSTLATIDSIPSSWAGKVMQWILVDCEVNSNAHNSKSEKSADPIEQIKKLKELLDADIITQIEFDNKKEQLLSKI